MDIFVDTIYKVVVKFYWVIRFLSDLIENSFKKYKIINQIFRFSMHFKKIFIEKFTLSKQFFLSKNLCKHLDNFSEIVLKMTLHHYWTNLGKSSFRFRCKNRITCLRYLCSYTQNWRHFSSGFSTSFKCFLSKIPKVI